MTNQPNNTSTTTNPVGRFMVAVGSVLEYKNTGKILILQRSFDLDWQPGEWEIGYGRIDQFESPEVGLRRELKEEIGVTDITIKSILSSWRIFRGPEKAENELIGITYHCQTSQQNITLSDEHAAYQWVEPAEALKLIKVEGIQRDVKKFIELKNDLTIKSVKKSAIKIGADVIGFGVGAFIFNDENKVLLTLRGEHAKNEVGKWEIPGGSIEFGETIEQAIKREIKEELGIEIEVKRMLQLADHLIPDEHQHWISPTYICAIVSGTPEIKEPLKCEKIGWFTLEEAEKLPLSIITKKDIELLKNQIEPSH